MLAIVPEWARLLVWPARLQAEYGPPGLSVTGAFGARHGIGLLLLLAWLAAVLGTFRRFPVIAFGLVWVAVSLAPISNTVIPTGIVLAERTLFLPSAGMMLAIGAGWSLLYEHTRAPKHRRSVVTAMTALVLGLGLARSAERATMWRSQEHFFARLPREAPTTYRSHRAAAQYFAHSGRPAQAERAWQRVLQLYDRDGTAFEELGQLYRARRRCDLALPVFEDGLSKHPDRTPLRSRYIECLLALGDTGRAIRAAEAGLRLGLTEFEQVITRLGGVR
jgi:tetratricopeptide (TPR) repeat protein